MKVIKEIEKRVGYRKEPWVTPISMDLKDEPWESKTSGKEQ